MVLWENIDFGGRSHRINLPTQGTIDLKNTGWTNRGTSSIEIVGLSEGQWSCFYETSNHTGDDMLFVQGSGRLRNLHTIVRPHGNNHWGDRIQGVASPVTGPSSSLNENSTRIYHHKNSYDNGDKGARNLGTDNQEWWQ